MENVNKWFSRFGKFFKGDEEKISFTYVSCSYLFWDFKKSSQVIIDSYFIAIKILNLTIDFFKKISIFVHKLITPCFIVQSYTTYIKRLLK